MGTDSTDAEAAARINSNLAKEYGQVGLPALSGNLDYVHGALSQGGNGLPGYVNQAYAAARGGAADQASLQQEQARSAVVGRLGRAGGGALLQGIGQVAGAGGSALTAEQNRIGTTQALAGVEQRNKLLGSLMGQGVSSTNLSAGFGQMTNAALGQAGAAPGAYPYVVGGLSAATGAYGNWLMNRSALAPAPPGSSASSIQGGG